VNGPGPAGAGTRQAFSGEHVAALGTELPAPRSDEVSGRLLLRAMPKIEIADTSSATIVATGSIHPGVPRPSARASTATTTVLRGDVADSLTGATFFL
jgi:hypothetical protein